jgi:hypothetical protein
MMRVYDVVADTTIADNISPGSMTVSQKMRNFFKLQSLSLERDGQLAVSFTCFP